MDWIYSTHLETLASLDPCASFLGLLVWTQSGGAPHSPDAPRYPVALGSRAAIAKRLGVGPATLRRHWATFTEHFAELDGGRYTPALGAWPTPKTGRAGRALYVRISPSAVHALAELPKRADLRRAHAALRLALKMLPRLRAARYRGESSIVWTNDQIAEQLKMGRSTILPALRLLELSGLIVTGGDRYRRISATRGILAEVPRVREGCPQKNPQPVENSRHFAQEGDRFSTAGGIVSRPISYGVEQDPNSVQAPRETRGVDCTELRKIREAISASLPDLTGRGVAELARHCRSEEEALDWMRREVPALAGRDNPAGTMIQMARQGISSPRKISGWARRYAKEHGERHRAPTERERAAQAAAVAQHVSRQDARRARQEEETRAAKMRAAKRIRELRAAANAADRVSPELVLDADALAQEPHGQEARSIALELRRRQAEQEKEARRQNKQANQERLAGLLATLGA